MWRTPKYTGPERRKRKRWRPRPFRVLLCLLALVFIGYGIAVFSLVNQESTLVLEAGRTLAPNRPSFTYEQIDVPRRDGLRQFAWVMPARNDAPWILFLHGNASTIASPVSLSHYRALRNAGLNVAAPEYRGFGGLDGAPNEHTLTDDVRAAYDYLRAVRGASPRSIVVYGWSLGSALAIDLASQVETAGLVLEGAPASQTGMSQRRYPLFPMRLLMQRQYESIEKIVAIRTPILFLHSPEDDVVPIAQGRMLFDAATAQKTFIEVRGGHLNAADADGAKLSDAVRAFLQQNGLFPADRPEARTRLP
jgi:esterase/lipase